METFLEHALPAVSWLNLGTTAAIAEFSAHFGWALAVCALAYAYGGWTRFKIFAIALILYALTKELVEDGHLYAIASNVETPEEFKDLATDLLSRLTPVGIASIIFSRKEAP